MDDEPLSPANVEEEEEASRTDASARARVLDASRLQEPLRTLSLRPPARVGLGASMGEAVRKMREAKAGSCLVEAADGTLAGIVTERNLLVSVPLKGADLEVTPVREFMHPDPETLRLDHPIAYALNRMAVGGYRNVPLVDRTNRAVGLVTLRDIVNDLVEHFGDDVLNLPPTRRAGMAKEREGA